MGVSLYEGDKNEKGGAGIEITANKVVNLLLRDENNLIKIDGNQAAYVDLQLQDGVKTTDTLPVGVTTGRVLAADGWVATGTMLCFKTTSGDYVTWIYGDDGKLYIDNGTGTFKQIYLKSEVDALFTQLRGEISAVGYSGEYNDLLNKPTLGTASALDIGSNPGNIPVIKGDGRLDPNIVPSTGVMTTYTVTNKSDLTTISNAVKGDIGVVTSENKTYILSNEPYSTLSNWTELLFPTGSVSSVNGFTGAVNLTTGYIQESNNKLFVSQTEKNTWNNKLGSNNVSTVALTGSYSDLNNKPVIPAGQIQSDWEQNDQTAVDYIQNKPTIDSSLSTSSQNAIQNGAVATAVNTINTNITNIQGDVSNLQTAIGSASGDITTIEGEITTLQGDVSDLQTDVAGKQDTLVSGTNIKTINNESILGSGNIDISSVVTEGASLGTFLKAMKASGTAHNVSFPSGSDTTYTFRGLGYINVSMFYGHALSINGINMFYESFDSGVYSVQYYVGVYTVGPGDVVRIWRPGKSGSISVTAQDYY